jgi:hypothetical protein
MVYLILYCGGVAFVLASLAYLRRMKLKEDRPDVDPSPWWAEIGVMFLIAMTWPVWVTLFIVISL